MADDKKKEAEEKPAKKKLPAIVLVAVGAIVGGAGVVFAVPPKTVEIPKEEPPPKFLQLINPDEIAHTFNPRDSKRLATVAVKFVYTVREDLEGEAFETIKAKWPMVSDVVWTLLKKRSTEELNSDGHMNVLKQELRDELDRRLFRDGADGHEPLARVSEILIVRCFWQ